MHFNSANAARATARPDAALSLNHGINANPGIGADSFPPHGYDRPIGQHGLPGRTAGGRDSPAKYLRYYLLGSSVAHFPHGRASGADMRRDGIVARCAKSGSRVENRIFYDIYIAIIGQIPTMITRPLNMDKATAEIHRRAVLTTATRD